MMRKTDWKTIAMPSQVETFIIEKTISDQELAYLQEGHQPQEMEDKWFMYFENHKLFIHRSWSGYCIYIVDVSETGKLNVCVNRNSEQYKETNMERDKLMVQILINQLTKQRGENTVLMKQYLSCKDTKR